MDAPPADEMTGKELFRLEMEQNQTEFAKYDADESEQLDFNEFCKLIREREVGYNHTELEMTQRFEELDRNGNGKIDMDEYLAYALQDSLARSADQVCSLFSDWDEDGTGMISKVEFRRAIKGFGFDCRRRDIDSIFDQMDSDASGQIDFNEMERCNLLLRHSAHVLITLKTCRHPAVRHATGICEAASCTAPAMRSEGFKAANCLRPSRSIRTLQYSSSSSPSWLPTRCAAHLAFSRLTPAALPHTRACAQPRARPPSFPNPVGSPDTRDRPLPRVGRRRRWRRVQEELSTRNAPPRLVCV